jgi:hypothetical protein
MLIDKHQSGLASEREAKRESSPAKKSLSTLPIFG